jgi:hypothetical protein
MTKVLATADRQKEIVPIFDIVGVIATTLQIACTRLGACVYDRLVTTAIGSRFNHWLLGL